LQNTLTAILTIDGIVIKTKYALTKLKSIFVMINLEMKIKLTLTVEKSIVTSIKQYAQDNGTSVSKMVEDFFIDKIKEKPMNNKIDSEIKALMGIIKEKDIDLKALKSDYFKQKYDL
jgi:hypothetical protein